MRGHRWRYLLLKIVSDEDISEDDLVSSLREVTMNLFGLIGLLKISPKIIRYDPSRRVAILRCSAEVVDEIRAAVALLHHMSGRPASAFAVRSSGTIAALIRATRQE